MTHTFLKLCRKMLSVPARVGLGLLIACILCFIAISLRAISRTKRTPRNTRFLTKGMLVLDFIGVSCILIRMFIADERLYYDLLLVGFVTTNTSFITVAVMCVERLVLCQSPMWYIAYFNHRRLRVVAVCIWIIFPNTAFFLRFVVCQQVVQDPNQKEQCMLTLAQIISGNIYLITALSYVCYFKIFVILRNNIKRTEQMFPSTKPNTSSDQAVQKPDPATGDSAKTDTSTNQHEGGQLSNDKGSAILIQTRSENLEDSSNFGQRNIQPSDGTVISIKTNALSTTAVAHVEQNVHTASQYSIRNRNTYLVFAYLVSMTVALGFVVMYILFVSDSTVIQVASVVIVTVNGTMDSLMYVLWFKECKLELMKMMAVCRPSLYGKAELQRIQIYDIVTAENINKP